MSEKEIIEDKHIIEKTKVRFYNSRIFRVNFLALFVGIVGALAAYGFKSLVELIRNLSTKFNELMGKIGDGAAGIVRKAKVISSGKQVAVKFLVL